MAVLRVEVPFYENKHVHFHIILCKLRMSRGILYILVSRSKQKLTFEMSTSSLFETLFIEKLVDFA